MFRLNNGVEIPEMGLGVYKMNAGKEMDDAVRYAYEQGYRLFDTAQMYKNESGLGEALEKNRIPRQDIFLISKVDNCNQGYGRTIESFGESLERLKTDYLDSFLVHWPGQNRERMLDTWKAMEKLYTDGKVRSIGVCNFEVCQLEYLLAHCKVRPMIDQIEHTPFMHDEKLLGFCRENEIQVMAWGPLLRGNLDEDEIGRMAAGYNKTSAQLLLRWNVQQGIIPIPKSKNKERLLQNISISDFEITEEDMKRMNAMNQNKRTSYDPMVFDF